jgi:hypothetical protein
VSVSKVKKKKLGSASSDICPKAGYMRVYNKFGMSYCMETRCKTRRCLGCRDKVQSLIRQRIEAGCLMVGPSYLITLTYKATTNGYGRGAASVRGDWKRWLRTMKEHSPNLSWFKVMELTKKKTPHMHVIAGGLSENPVTACETRASYSERWLQAPCSCREHEYSRYWRDVTGDSYVVDVRAVVGAGGAAKYLSKYLTKAVMQRDELEEMGFKRMFQTSRNWPGFERLRLAGTARGDWVKTEFGYKGVVGSAGFQSQAENDIDNPLGSRVGSPLAKFFADRGMKKRKLSIIEGIYNAQINWPANEPIYDTGRA